MENPKVSVVIPFYSNVEWLEEAVDSVLNQTYDNIQIIVVNDGSKEDVVKFLKKYRNKIDYYFQNNMGPGAARNLGIEKSKGEYIALLDSDDLWLPQKIEKQVKYMLENPGFLWSHCGYQTFGFGQQVEVMSQNMRGNIFPTCFRTCRIATPCVIINKSVFVDPKYRFNSKMRYGQDFYLWVLLSEKYELGYLNEKLCKVRMRGGNAGKRAYVMLRAKRELWRNLYESKDISLENIPYSIKSAYKLCDYGYIIIENTKKMIKNDSIIEFLSKILYLLPYTLLKATRK